MRKGDHPIAEARVKLFPEPANQHRTDLIRNASTDEHGRFIMKNVVPGKYRVRAVAGQTDADNDTENNEDDSPVDPSAGASIVVAERESKTVQLKLYGKRE